MKAKDDLDERARALFRAARADRPEDGARDRLLVQFAEARRVEEPPEAPGAAPAEAAALPVRLPPPKSRRTQKLVAIGLAVAAAATWVVAVRHARRPDVAISSELLPARKRTPAAHAMEPEPPVTAPIQKAPPQKARSAAAVHSPREESSANVESPSPPAHLASLSEEIAALDQARQLLASGDANGALRKLDEYSGALGGTRLVLEAALLRIQALARAGRASDASQLARRFIRENPGSPLVDRARAFIREKAAGGQTTTDAGGEP